MGWAVDGKLKVNLQWPNTLPYNYALLCYCVAYSFVPVEAIMASKFQISCGGGGVESEAKIEAKSKWGYALIIISTLAVFHVAFGQVNGSYWL